MKNKKFEYDVKCRKCGKITRVWFGRDVGMDEARFKEWAKEHSTFPIQKQCDCDKEMIMFHDIVSFSH